MLGYSCTDASKALLHSIAQSCSFGPGLIVGSCAASVSLGRTETATTLLCFGANDAVLCGTQMWAFFADGSEELFCFENAVPDSDEDSLAFAGVLMRFAKALSSIRSFAMFSTCAVLLSMLAWSGSPCLLRWQHRCGSKCALSQRFHRSGSHRATAAFTALLPSTVPLDQRPSRLRARVGST